MHYYEYNVYCNNHLLVNRFRKTFLTRVVVVSTDDEFEPNKKEGK